MMNHLAVYPSGDPRNLAGTREDSEVLIEYDAAGFLEYLAENSKHSAHGIYFCLNNCIVTAEHIPGDFAMRVFEKGSMYNLWRNPNYYKATNRNPASRGSGSLGTSTERINDERWGSP